MATYQYFAGDKNWHFCVEVDIKFVSEENPFFCVCEKENNWKKEKKINVKTCFIFHYVRNKK